MTTRRQSTAAAVLVVLTVALTPAVLAYDATPPDVAERFILPRAECSGAWLDSLAMLHSLATQPAGGNESFCLDMEEQFRSMLLQRNTMCALAIPAGIAAGAPGALYASILYGGLTLAIEAIRWRAGHNSPW